MRQQKRTRKCLVSLFTFLILGFFLSFHPAAAATRAGNHFDHIVILAMENQNYADVLGDGTPSGCPSGTAPFLCSMLPYSSTIPNYHSYCSGSSDPACSAGISGCSAACYTAVTSGDTYGVSDGLGTGSVSATNVFDRISTTGLSWTEYEEGGGSGSIRGPDHSPCLQYADTASSPNCVQLSSDLIGNSQVMGMFNSNSPSNYIWITPTDGHNMHDVSISTGDSWLQTLLVGSGSITSPASGSLLSTNLFTNPSFHSLLWIWWDENDPSPNIEYGPMISKGFISSSNSWDEYSQLKMIENNWGIPTLVNDAQASALSDIFGSSSSTSLALSISSSPSSPSIGTSIAFTGSATGGTPPYTYSWSFGDGSSAIGASVTHAYTKVEIYNVTMIVTDSTGLTNTKTTQVNVAQTSSPGQLPGLGTPLSFLLIALLLGVTATIVLLLVRYHAHNRRLQHELNSQPLQNRATVRVHSKKSKRSYSGKPSQ